MNSTESSQTPNAFKLVEYVCQFCAKAGAVKFDPVGFLMCRPEHWTPLAACDKCADYEEARRRIEDEIFKVVRASTLCRKNPDAQEKCRLAVVGLTKRFAALVCTYHNKTDVWEPDFPNAMLDKPEKVSSYLKDYRRCITKI